MQTHTEHIAFEQLTNEQQSIVNTVLGDRRNCCVTGAAGTGKSAVLKYLKQKANKERIRFQVVGTTGIAAVNIGGITLHSFASLPVNRPDLTVERLAATIEKSDRYINTFTNITTTDVLAIDEVSMLSATTLDYFSQLCQLVRRNPAPFGGMTVIFFGDFLQLPPVGDSINRNPPFAFESEEWFKANIKLYHLTKIFRQVDPEYISVLSKIRRGIQDADVKRFLARLVAQPLPKEGSAVIIHTHNKSVDEINNKFMDVLNTQTETYQASDNCIKDIGEQALKELQRSCLATSPLTLKVGCRVMLLKNLDFERGLINGSCGKILEFVPYGGDLFKTVPVVKFDNGVTVEVKPMDWKTINAEDQVIAARVQIPLRVAYAITAHKSQGLTFDSTVLFLNRAFNYGQGYVALSRCKTPEQTYLREYNKRAFCADRRAQRFYLNPHAYCGNK